MPLPARNLDPTATVGRTALSFALQGGGSLGAFTWGVLDRLLEDESLTIDTVSGASAGAINAAVLASGFAVGGAAEAREALERFWRRASGAAFAPALNEAIALSSRVLSPYQFNPFDLNPLRLLLNHEIDFERIRAASPFRLLIGTTRVTDGSLRLFNERELTPDVLLASACLPLLNQAITIEGEEYWDGGYAANPPLMPLIEASATPRILVIQIIPSRGADHPRTAKDIVRRLDHITFNSSLTHDLETIALVKGLIGSRASPDNKIAACTVEKISAEDIMPSLNGVDALRLDWSFLRELRDAGRAAAGAWIGGNLAGMTERSAPEAGQPRPSPERQSA